MRQLLPHPDPDFDLHALLDRADRPPPAQRPWVMANMVTSLDGAYSVEGRSDGLAGPADRQLFHALRAAADAVLVAAGTARQERYGRPATRPEWSEHRRAAGRATPPRLVVVSRSLSIPLDQPFLAGDGPVPLVLHPGTADTSGAPAGVELRSAGQGEDVDLHTALTGLREDGTEQVMCEGGPELLGQLHRDGLLDELFLTISPRMVGGDRVGLLGAAQEHLRDMHLHRALEADSFLFLTYRRLG